MTRHEYTSCDDCGRRLDHQAPFTVDCCTPLTFTDLARGQYLHACSTACLLRIASDLHRGVAPKGA